MNFKKWFNEMVAMSLPNKAQFSFPCDAVKIKLPAEMQGKFPCQDLPVTMIDFRFEDYPNPPKLSMFSKFMARLPKSTEFISYLSWTGSNRNSARISSYETWLSVCPRRLVYSCRIYRTK
jgi:hypothetical protein